MANLLPIKKPGQSGSLYLNYKHYCSVVLLAVADSNFHFDLIMAKTLMPISSGIVPCGQKTSAQATTDARQTNRHVNSSSAICETLQRTAQPVTSVEA
jgi:hypothetical protein